MTLKEELEHGTLSRVRPDEPIFVLRAQDRLAPMAVREWIGLAIAYSGLPDCSKAVGRLPTVPPKKLREAGNLAERMEDWARDNADGGKIPD